jgi:hypothetical protein
MTSPSSLLHMIFGLGDPLASQVRFTGPPSFTIRSGDVLESMMVGGTEKGRKIYN